MTWLKGIIDHREMSYASLENYGCLPHPRMQQPLFYFNNILCLLKDQIIVNQLDYNKEKLDEKALDTCFKNFVLRVTEFFYRA